MSLEIRKDIENYRFEENYEESKTPVFRSDPYGFSVTLYNLNYGVNGDDIGGETSEEVREKFGKSSVKVRDNHVSKANNTQKRILDYLASNPNMTATDLSLKTGLSIRAIEKNIKKLKDCGLLVRHGSARAGYWEVVLDENK
ncbi:MAG: winged helix-turn-helix transcriptional regulator [Spirochaetales bacterium]|nr:winged helix-turn-helix transcriptional regulator [Spirochaetales bacterium]